MNHFFLLNEAISLTDIELFKEGMGELVAIQREDNDIFLKHNSIWELAIITDFFENHGDFASQSITKFLEQLKISTEYIGTEAKFDELYGETPNAFLGIDFKGIKISIEKQIINEERFIAFKKTNLWNITFKGLWEKREELFPNLILCGEVEKQISRIGNSKSFNQIVARLKEFDKAIEDWTEGNFSYRNINKNYSLVISPESKGTMNQYSNERLFSLPNGGTESFELHIKTGDLRFHFYPDNTTKKVYIGYIGPHLSTITT